MRAEKDFFKLTKFRRILFVLLLIPGAIYLFLISMSAATYAPGGLDVGLFLHLFVTLLIILVIGAYIISCSIGYFLKK